jgi:hypothetical protein
MANSATRSREHKIESRFPGFGDRCYLRARPDALMRMAQAAYDIPLKADGTQNIRALTKAGGGVAYDFRERVETGDPIGAEMAARMTALHAHRTGSTPGEAFDELFEIVVEQRVEAAVAA